MVVTQKMKHRMHGQIHDLPLVAVAEVLSLLGAARHRDHHVAQQHGAGLGIGFAVGGVEGARLQLVEREAQHVGGAVHAAKLAIDAADALIVG